LKTLFRERWSDHRLRLAFRSDELNWAARGLAVWQAIVGLRHG
jgi:hypothetical protein